MKKVARLRITQDEQFVPPGVKINANPEQTVRTTGRIKKPKAVFDPSDNYMPRSQRMSTQISVQATTPPGKLAASTSTSPSTTGTRRERSLSTGSTTSNNSISLTSDVCSVCLKREPRRGGNYRNKLVSCVDCGKKVHKQCMSVDFIDVRLNFKCDSCRACEACSKSDNPNANNVHNESAMPVKIIRQIIGDNVNLMTSTAQKTQTPVAPVTPVAVKEEFKKSPEPTKPPKPSPQQNQKVPPKPLEQERVKISEAAVEASIKAAALRRRSTDTASTSSSDDSEDEDYEYVEKKKRKIENKYNSNHDIKNASETNSEKQLNTQTNNNVPKKEVNDLPKRENVQTWSVEQVTAYIAEYFPNEAFVFKDQEIDGNALLLLKRSDVVQKLPLKLGPSLRIYNLILKVQTQTTNDPTLGWDCSVDSLLPSTE